MTATLTPATTDAPPLDLAARLAATDAAMAVRLQETGMGVDVNTAHLPASPDWTDAVRGPVTMPQSPVDLYPTPVAALLQRAHRRIIQQGWCKGYAVDGQGAICLQWAIRKEARGDIGLEAGGLTHLLDTIRRHLDPNAQSVPSWNDAQRDGHLPLRILDTAANTAHQRGI